jgi:hypothetical protein
MARVDRSGLIPALETTFAAGIKAGVWGEGSFDAQIGLGPVALAVVLKIQGFVGAQADFSASAFLNWREGVGASFSASAMAGAESSGSVVAELTLGKAQLEVGAGYEALAGAKAELSGSIEVGLSGVKAQFEASAFAGAKIEGSAHASVKVMGKKIISATGKVSVSAGAGVEVSGVFEIKSGKLRIGGDLAATLKGGVGAGVDLEIDFYALADVIVAQVGELAEDNPAISAKSPDYERKPLTDQAEKDKKHQLGYDAVYEDFLAYANKKLTQGEQGVKRDRVQAIIQNRAPLLRSEFAYVETDEGIEQAARDAFGPMLTSIVVQAGYIRGFQVASAAEVGALKQTKQQEETWRKARDVLQKDFATYCMKKSATGANGVKQENVQAVIDKHWKQLSAAFPGSEADEVVKFAANGMKVQYLEEFEVLNGRITKFTAPEDKAKAVKAGVVKNGEDAALARALQNLGGRLAGYRTKLLAQDGTTLDTAALQKLIAAATSKVSGQLSKPEVDAAIKQQVLTGLDGIVEDITITKGVITGAPKEKSGGLAAARAQQATGRAAAAESAAVAAFAASLTSYLDLKTGTGEHGLKQQQVQARLDKATGKVRQWAATDEAGQQLEQAARTALGKALTDIEIKAGKVTKFVEDEAVVLAAKQDRRTNGKKRLAGGEEQDNARRRMVADAVRKDFAGYAARVRAGGEKPTGGPAPKVDVVTLQGIIDRRLKQIRADVLSDVGDSALVDAITVAFGPLIKTVTVTELRITSLDVESDFAAITKAKRSSSAQVRQAQADLTAELAASATRVPPTQALVQTVINKYKGKFGGLPSDEVDTALTMAVTNALRTSVDDLEIVNAKITRFALKKTPAKVH